VRAGERRYSGGLKSRNTGAFSAWWLQTIEGSALDASENANPMGPSSGGGSEKERRDISRKVADARHRGWGHAGMGIKKKANVTNCRGGDHGNKSRRRGRGGGGAMQRTGDAMCGGRSSYHSMVTSMEKRKTLRGKQVTRATSTLKMKQKMTKTGVNKCERGKAQLQ